MSKKQDDIAIKVSNVSKSFKLPHEKNTSVKGALIGLFRTKRTYEKQEVLKDINFEIKKGEFFGIVGRNGSGKSTLLKLLAGIYTPDKGSIQINGKLTPFIELGVGFNPELTGRENVFLNGALLGFSRKEMEAMYDEIVEFAELEKFMDQKLKNYSSGMQVRLAFSIAIQANTDVLLLDEVLAVGDEAFQRKCFQYFSKLKKAKKTVILVTHSMDSVQQFCTRAMLIDKGHKSITGSPLKISQIYRELNSNDGVTVNKPNKTKKEKSEIGTKYVDAKVIFKNLGEKLLFDSYLTPKQDLEDPIVAIEVFKDNGEPLIRWVTDEKIPGEINLESNKEYNLRLILENIFPVGRFSVRLMVRKRDRSADYGIFNDITTFEIENTTPYNFNTLWKPREEYTLKVDGG